jgi:hypothetical protein
MLIQIYVLYFKICYVVYYIYTRNYIVYKRFTLVVKEFLNILFKNLINTQLKTNVGTAVARQKYTIYRAQCNLVLIINLGLFNLVEQPSSTIFCCIHAS